MLYFNCTLYHSTSVFEILNWLLIIFMINTLAFQYSIQSSLFTFQLQVSPIPPWVIVYASIKSNCFLFSIIQHAVLHLCKFIPVFSQWRPALFQVINFYEFFMTQIRHLYEASPNQLLSYVCVCVCVCLVAQSCPTLYDPMDCSLQGSFVHGDSPGKNTEVGCHGGSSQHRDRTQISYIAGRLPSETPRKPKNTGMGSLYLLQGNLLAGRNQIVVSCIASGFFTS